MANEATGISSRSRSFVETLRNLESSINYCQLVLLVGLVEMVYGNVDLSIAKRVLNDAHRRVKENSENQADFG